MPIPTGYQQQLAGIEVLFGYYNAPYFPGPDFDDGGGRKGSNDTITGRRGSDLSQKSADVKRVVSKNRPSLLTNEARQLWAGYRGIEEYAREVFPIEEEANGKTWMTDKAMST